LQIRRLSSFAVSQRLIRPLSEKHEMTNFNQISMINLIIAC